MALALLAFFLGYQVGTRTVPPAPPPAVAPLISEEARSGNLEVLLNRVDEASAKNLALSFPADLPAPSEAPAPPPDPNAPPAVAPPPPEVVRVGEASVPAGAAVPSVEGSVPAGGWAIEIGATPSPDEAQTWLKRLAEAELSAYRLNEVRDGVVTARVRVGGYATKAEAVAAVAAVTEVLGLGSAEVVSAP